ncbi:MAG TPA: hypothetical protein VIN61_17205 [Gammaproteobacteria bacterium]
MVSGTVTYDFVPVAASPRVRLSYEATEARPAREVVVELVSGDSIIATTTTDAAGRYSFAAPANTDVIVRARAESVRAGPPGWDIQVRNNAQEDALWVVEGTLFNTGSTDVTRNLHAPSGWDATAAAYTGARSAAPFAILDTLYDATQFVLTADPAIVFPPLRVHWSPNNAPTVDEFDPATGRIPSSLFVPGVGIYLVGAADNDTDEYDRHVIVHEWGHYFEHHFARSDSIGGPHSLGDRLDLRVAFGEGWGNALSAMVTGDPVYRDAGGVGQAQGFAFDIERGRPRFTRDVGWYSEESVQEILYDLFDAEQDTDVDTLPLGFGPVYTVLVGHQRETSALTSIFSFISGLKAALATAAERDAVDRIVDAHNIEPVVDDYGTGEDNAGTPPNPGGSNEDVLPVYRKIEVGGPAVRVCSTNEFESSRTGAVNKLGSRQFLRFRAQRDGRHTFTAVTAELPDDLEPGKAADPDMVLHQRGPVALPDCPAQPGTPLGQCAPSASCSADAPRECRESFSWPLTAGDYVLEVYEWTNTNESDDPEHPPIGRTCMDVTITGP